MIFHWGIMQGVSEYRKWLFLFIKYIDNQVCFCDDIWKYFLGIFLNIRDGITRVWIKADPHGSCIMEIPDLRLQPTSKDVVRHG